MVLSRRQFLRVAGHGLGGVALAATLAKASASTALAATKHQEGGAESLLGKVLCGYQGWFRCPGDDTGRGWRHWSRDSSRIGPDTLTFDMWPDMSEYFHDEKYPAPGFTYPDGQQAHLFSSANRLTVDRHFDWMQQYDIDGVLLQRFVVGLNNPPNDIRVLTNVRDAANRTGRVFAVEYDMSGAPTDQLLARMANDWHWLVDTVGITSEPYYLYHDGRPVLAIWGFFRDRFDAQVAHRIIEVFTTSQDYPVCLIGGCQWWWRTESDPGWARAFRRFDVISPWNVGNVTVREGRRYASTGSWAADFAEATRTGMLYLPVIYPGFSWDNLQRLPPGTSNIPRLGGEFYWDQFLTANDLGIGQAKVAMFDEVDEGTAIFKVTNDPPAQGYFVTYEGLDNDWYLLLTGAGSRLLRGQ